MDQFSEARYLALNPDVAAAVASGQLDSGYAHFTAYGEAEGRWPALAREDKIFAGLDRNADGLEIGAGYSPLVAGPRAKTLDHLDQAGLIAKYSDQGVDTAKIRPVTYVWRGEPLHELVQERFDWIVASHVVEHVPDLIGFLNDCGELLKPGGTLTLAVPDRRYTFDHYRPVSGLGSVIDAHLQRRTKPSIGSVMEHYRQHCATSAGIVWNRSVIEAPDFLPDIATQMRALAERGDYVDTHVWVFTPSSFRLMILDLRELGFLALMERTFSASSGCEFFIQLTSEGVGAQPSRAELALQARHERAQPDP